ncbi:MAG TPA: hypothetical protein VKX17_00250 [Planctomycetota bacterium]|nr:hypothetical protein [Planctomycetota bacterium]
MRCAILCLAVLTSFIHAESAPLPLIAPARDGTDRAPDPIKDLHSSHKIKVVYFIPTDREPVKNYAAKIETLLAFVNDVYKRDLCAKGYACNGLDFEFKDGKLDIRILKAQNVAATYNFAPAYNASPKVFDLIMPEVAQAYGSWNKSFYFVLAETYDDGPWKFEWPGTFALGANWGAEGGAGTFCSWILRDEFCATSIAEQMKLLADDSPIPGRTALGNGRLNSPRFQFINDGFGAVCHELGHAFGCPHDMRRESSFIMGNGFRSFRVNFIGSFANRPPVCFSADNARILSHSRFLCDGVDCADTTPPKVSVKAPASLKPGATKISLTVTASDDKALGAALFFVSQGDSVRGGTELSGTKQELSVELPVPALKAGEIMVTTTVVDHGGNFGTAKNRIKIEDNAEQPKTDAPK